MEPYTLHLGNCHDVLDTLEENSVDSIVTDTPYEINFMAKSWDNAGVAFNPVTWEKALRVLKPGGHMLVFGHSRKMHRITVAIEDAGFEIRDTLMWIYGSGFPKSHDISKAIDKKLGAERGMIGTKRGVRGADGTGHENAMPGKGTGIKQAQIDVDITTPATPQAKQYDGWGTALKPAYEPIVLARKPFKGSVAENVLEHGTGGINIDECRVGFGTETDSRVGTKAKNESTHGFWQENIGEGVQMYKGNGRFPANVMHDGSEESTKDMWDWETDSDASRYFYCAKASKKDRDEGLFKDFETVNDGRKKDIDNAYQRGLTPRKNTHPTVKPTELMQYLVRLITPKGGTVLDPFMGSGSTGKATMIENQERNADYKFVGIDLTEEYIDIAKARIEYGLNYFQNKEKEAQKVSDQQTSIFDFESE